MASLEAKVSGTINIGSVSIPISTVLPPTTPGVFTFDYEAANKENPTASGSVADFLGWLKSAFGLDIPVTDLPASLQQLSFGLVKLKFDTSFTIFDAIVLLGTITSGTFASTWTPITAYPSFTLTDVSFEADLPAA
jgi:hypothetical protein